jgi:predicted 2-oxoglutarate/Fe(II)-dependent dioxygenase YbiX
VDLFIADHVLDETTCRWIQAAMDDGVQEPASVLSDSVDVEVESRRASEIDVGDDVIALVESRLDAHRDAIAAFYGLRLEGREGCGFLRYEAGGFYGPHVDRAEVPSWPDAARRAITIVVFLNSSAEAQSDGEFSGGWLRLFPDGLDARSIDVTARRGALVAFPSSIPHEVTPVVRGQRDTIVDWCY